MQKIEMLFLFYKISITKTKQQSNLKQSNKENDYRNRNPSY
jgi:hypothetical protein